MFTMLPLSGEMDQNLKISDLDQGRSTGKNIWHVKG